MKPEISPSGTATESHRSPKSEWFRDWFDDNYTLVYSGRDDAEASKFVARWPIWDEDLTGKWCLDLGCGAGRFARAINKAGMKVLGLDLSRTMLKNALRVTEERQGSYFVRADIRHLPAKGPFALAASLFTSFGYFERDEEHRSLLRNVSRLLGAGGLIALDLPNRTAVVKLVNDHPLSERNEGKLRIIEKRTLSNNTQRVEKDIEIIKSGESRRYRESVRLFDAEELASLTIRAGFVPLCPLWGDYNGGPLTELSPRMIYFGRKGG
jgi:SAM-dependent methyltransferase